MIKGMEKGHYVLRFPDVMSTCICAALGGTSELAMPAALTAFIAPCVVGSPLMCLGCMHQKSSAVVGVPCDMGLCLMLQDTCITVECHLAVSVMVYYSCH